MKASFLSPSPAGAFFDRIGLAGQQRLVDEEVAALQNLAVGGNEIAGAEQHDVAGNDASLRKSWIPFRRG